MKWLAMILYLCCATLACAADDPPPPALKPLRGATPPNVTVINGQKFYSLSGVKRFNGVTNNPSALSVLHHPRPPAPMAASRGSELPSEAPPPTALSTAGKAPAAAPDTVLSIFSPDERQAPPVIAPTK